MHPDELRQLFPNASEACIRANLDSPSPVPCAVIKYLDADASSRGLDPRKETNQGRYKVRIVSRRTRLLDPDNLCPKFFIDALRYERLIPDDSAKYIVLEVSQEKVKRKTEELTIIQITKI